VSAELLAQIWERPTDRELLAVYADWLASQGQTTRAEFMQLSLLAKPTPQQERRRETLRKKHRGEWLGAARPFIWTWEESEESPGFVARAQCSTVKLTKGLDEVARLGPRLRVSVTEPKAKREAVALAKLPLGRKLHGMSFYENDAQWISDDFLATIAPALVGLRSLVLDAWEARSSDRGWRAMLPHLEGLADLELSLGENPEAWIEQLMDSSLPRTLKRLSVPGWLPPPLRDRLVAKLAGCTVEFRKGRRHRFNRASGYYIP
jgi:uncharacterized protein (TIGR02996 family)